MKFKVGDKVRVNRDPRNWTGYGQTNFVGIISNITEAEIYDGSRVIYWMKSDRNDDYYGGFHEQELEAVADEPRAKSSTQKVEPVCDCHTPGIPESQHVKVEEVYPVPTMWDLGAVTDSYRNVLFKRKRGIIMSAVDKVKNLALKATNRDEWELREAGFHNSCGELTSEGKELAWSYLEELVKDKLVTAAKEVNAVEE